MSPRLGEDRDRGQRADAVLAHQGPAAGLAARVGAQLAVQRRELSVVGVDHRQRDGDLLARGRRQRQARQPRARLGGQQATAGWGAVVIEHGLHALLPLAALIDQGVAQPDAGAQVEQVRGRDPRLG